MTRNELVEAVADYFGLDYPEKDGDGQYICKGFDWESGAYTDGDFGWRTFLSLENVVKALEDLCEEDEEDW